MVRKEAVIVAIIIIICNVQAFWLCPYVRVRHIDPTTQIVAKLFLSFPKDDSQTASEDITIKILEIIRCPVLYLKDDVSEK
jgi:hypothetical protein